MPVVIDEKIGVEWAIDVSGQSFDSELFVTGATTEDDAKTAVVGYLTPTRKGYPLQNYTINELGGGVWQVSFRYGARARTTSGPTLYSYDTTGGTQKVTHSKQTIASYPKPSTTAPDNQGAIGATGESVEGTEIIIPTLSIKATKYLPAASVTLSFLTSFLQTTGKINSLPFSIQGVTYNAKELLFVGGSINGRGVEDYEVQFNWKYSFNATGITVGAITGIEKKGWEYLWIRYATKESQKVFTQEPIAVYIEKVYDETPFSVLGAFT